MKNNNDTRVIYTWSMILTGSLRASGKSDTNSFDRPRSAVEKMIPNFSGHETYLFRICRKSGINQRKIIQTVLFLFLLLLPGITVDAQVYPKDIPTIEALVAGHKNVWSGLRDRRDKEAVNGGLSVRVADLTQKYDDVKEKTSKRFTNVYNGLIFGYEVTNIVTLIAQATPLMGEYASFMLGNATKHPLILKYYNSSYEGIWQQLNNCQNLFLYGNLFNSTYKQQYDLLIQIKSSLEIIIKIIQQTLYMSKSIIELDLDYNTSFRELMQDRGFQEKTKDIADKIIEQFGK